MEEKNKIFPEGHFIGLWTGIGVAIGSGIGVPIAIALGNMAFMGIGLPIGIAVGVGIGASQEAKYKAQGKIRPIFESEKKQQKKVMWTSLGLFLVGLLVFLGVFFLSR